MTSKFSIDNRELLQRISSGEAIVGIDFGNLIVRELAAFRLSAMDSEPVAYTDERNLGYIDRGRETAYLWGKQNSEASYVALYRHAQPAPVVPELRVDWQENEFSAGWNACRAAMLQAGTLTNEGTKQAWTGIPDIDNAINMLDRIDTLDSCDDDRIEAVKTVLRRLAGNSPVIDIDPASGPDRTVEVRYVAPPGYVMVPKEMTDEIGEAIAMQANCCGGIALDIYDAMIAAAPHDTPALNSLQSVDSVTGGWIPVSERMPEDSGRYWCYVEEQNDLGKSHYQWNCSWNGDRWWVESEGGGIVTHWMQLPAAPQEVK